MSAYPNLDKVMAGSHDEKEPDKDGDEPDGLSHEDHKENLKGAAEQMFEALKSGNKEHFASALDAYMDLHETKPKEDEPSAEDLGDEDEAPESGEGLKL